MNRYMKVDGQLWSELEVLINNSYNNNKKINFIENGEVWINKLPNPKKETIRKSEKLKEPAIKILNYEFEHLTGLEIKLLSYLRNHCLDKNSANFKLHTMFKDIEQKLHIEHRHFLRVLNSLEKKHFIYFDRNNQGKRDLKTITFVKTKIYGNTFYETPIYNIEDITDEDGFTYIPEKYYFEDLTGTEFKVKALLVKYNSLGKFVGKVWRSCFAGFAKIVNKAVSSVWRVIKHIEEKLLITVERIKNIANYKSWYTNFILN